MLDPFSSYSDFLCAANLFGSGSGQTLSLPPPHWQRAWQSRVAFWQSRGGFAINLSARSPLGAVHTPRVLDPPLSVATVLPPYHRLTTAAVKIPVGAKGCQGSRVSRPFFNRIKIFPRWTMDGPSPPPPPAWVNIYFSQIREEQEGNPLCQQKWDSVGCLFVIFQPATQDEPTITFNAKNGKLELEKSWPPPFSRWMTLDSANKPTPSHHDRLCALLRDFSCSRDFLAIISTGDYIPPSRINPSTFCLNLCTEDRCVVQTVDVGSRVDGGHWDTGNPPQMHLCQIPPPLPTNPPTAHLATTEQIPDPRPGP